MTGALLRTRPAGEWKSPLCCVGVRLLSIGRCESCATVASAIIVAMPPRAPQPGCLFGRARRGGGRRLMPRAALRGAGRNGAASCGAAPLALGFQALLGLRAHFLVRSAANRCP